MLEKNYTRQAYISNFMQGINELPPVEIGRPLVKNVKKREALLLKGQTDELNASFGSDHSSVFKQANRNINGSMTKRSVASSDGSQPTSPGKNLKLQFKMPLAENLIV